MKTFEFKWVESCRVEVSAESEIIARQLFADSLLGIEKNSIYENRISGESISNLEVSEVSNDQK